MIREGFWELPKMKVFQFKGSDSSTAEALINNWLGTLPADAEIEHVTSSLAAISINHRDSNAGARDNRMVG